jgi:hypothetical protein
MARFIIGAVAAAAALAVAAVLGTDPDIGTTWVVLGAVLAAVVAPLGGYGTLKFVFDRLPLAVRAQVSLVFAVVIAALEAVVATVPDVESFPRVMLAVLVAIGGGAGIWRNATPTADPRDDNGAPLVPLVAVEPSDQPRRPGLA